MPELFVLLYISTQARDATDGGLAAITRVARLRNADRGITGLLAYDGDTFVQWLEGDEGELSELLRTLRTDPRHCDLQVLRFDRAEGPRRHAGWHMGYHFVEDEHEALSRFRSLRGEAAVQAFQALALSLDVGAGNATPA